MIRMMAHTPDDESAETPAMSTGACGHIALPPGHRPALRERGRPSMARLLATMPDVGADTDFDRIQLSSADRLIFD
jgi:hypothetical protein